MHFDEFVQLPGLVLQQDRIELRVASDFAKRGVKGVAYLSELVAGPRAVRDVHLPLADLLLELVFERQHLADKRRVVK